VRLTVVGCAGSYPTAESPGSCYLLEQDGVRLLLDLGNGALGALQQHVDLVWPDALAAVVLSHCHVDHCVDLASLYVQRHYAPSPPVDRLRVLGPSDARARIAGVYGMADAATLDAQFAFEVLAPDPVTVGPFTITATRAAHPVESYSLRVEAGGASLTYSGDTGPSERLVELAQGTDVALFEASFVGDDNPSDLHMSGADAASTAARAGAGLLVLTHLVAWNDERQVLDEAAALFPGPIEIARAGMTITV
jgi:ribonuclease BN (tRNA processing enzyme)